MFSFIYSFILFSYEDFKNISYDPRHKKFIFAYAKTKTQISCAVTAADLRICFRHIDSTISLLLKCQASSHLMWLYSSVSVITDLENKKGIDPNAWMCMLISTFVVNSWHRHASYDITYAKTKTQTSCAVTAQLISTFLSLHR